VYPRVWVYERTTDFSLEDGASSTFHIKLFLSSKIHLLSIAVMYLHNSLSASRGQPKYCTPFSFISGSRIRGALPLFSVHYAQHRIHRQNTIYLQNIVDFEAIPALIDLPQGENNKIEADGPDAGLNTNTDKSKYHSCRLRTVCVRRSLLVLSISKPTSEK